MSDFCFSAHACNNKTYVGLGDSKGIEVIEEGEERNQTLVTLHDCIDDIAVHNDKIYTLGCHDNLFTMRVFDLDGTLKHSWVHADDDNSMRNQFTIVDNRIAILHRKNQSLLLYTLTGEKMNELPSPVELSTEDSGTYICTAPNHSVIISDRLNDTVFRLGVSSGDVMWENHKIVGPRGLTCYKDEYVLVSHRSTRTEIYILNLFTGEKKLHYYNIFGKMSCLTLL